MPCQSQSLKFIRKCQICTRPYICQARFVDRACRSIMQRKGSILIWLSQLSIFIMIVFILPSSQDSARSCTQLTILTLEQRQPYCRVTLLARLLQTLFKGYHIDHHIILLWLKAKTFERLQRGVWWH